MHDIAEFLSAHDPFAALGSKDLERLAENVEIEFFDAGETIFRQGEGRPTRCGWSEPARSSCVTTAACSTCSVRGALRPPLDAVGICRPAGRRAPGKDRCATGWRPRT